MFVIVRYYIIIIFHIIYLTCACGIDSLHIFADDQTVVVALQSQSQLSPTTFLVISQLK